MDTIELRHIINEKISLIDDESFLVAIKTIIDSKISSTGYQLSSFQKERINLGREQLLNGHVISNDQIQTEISQWLSSK